MLHLEKEIKMRDAWMDGRMDAWMAMREGGSKEEGKEGRSEGWRGGKKREKGRERERNLLDVSQTIILALTPNSLSKVL